MTLQTRLESLRARHASLEGQIAEEGHRPAPNTDALCRLKREKLLLKEEMERLREPAAAARH